MSSKMKLRTARFQDVHSIATLHAESWRRHYRGALSDSYLDGDVVSDRLTVWTDRLSHRRAGTITIVAEMDSEIVGFAHTELDNDPVYGALLDNLHVKHEFKRMGIGSALLKRSATAVFKRNDRSGLYLWVLEQNQNARAFYSKHGGIQSDRESRTTGDGGSALAFRVYWSNHKVLLSADQPKGSRRF